MSLCSSRLDCAKKKKKKNLLEVTRQHQEIKLLKNFHPEDQLLIIPLDENHDTQRGFHVIFLVNNTYTELFLVRGLWHS